MTYVITEPCIDVLDKSCIEECPVDCIYEGASMLYIHPDECVDCGACEPVCPVEAIFYAEDVPLNWGRFTAAGDDFASRVTGGGARGVAYAFDSAHIFADGERQAQAQPQAEPSPFLAGPAGTRIAISWDGSRLDAALARALLLVFDRVAVIDDDDRWQRGTTAEWQDLLARGLVAQIDLPEALATLDDDVARTFRDTLSSGRREGRPSRYGDGWQSRLVRGAWRQFAPPSAGGAPVIPAFDPYTVETASLMLRWIVQDRLARDGVLAFEFTTDPWAAAAFAETAERLIPGARPVSLPGERVLPSCAEAPIGGLLEFRSAAGPGYRRFADLLVGTAAALSHGDDEAALAVFHTPDEVAAAAYPLRQLMRGLPWSGRGYVGLGLVGVAGSLDPGSAFPPAEARPRSLFVVEEASTSWI
jgi:NAD-dependent dihydropyrimidine dehydrogenase PreA subunit